MNNTLFIRAASVFAFVSLTLAACAAPRRRLRPSNLRSNNLRNKSNLSSNPLLSRSRFWSP